MKYPYAVKINGVYYAPNEEIEIPIQDIEEPAPAEQHKIGFVDTDKETKPKKKGGK